MTATSHYNWVNTSDDSEYLDALPTGCVVRRSGLNSTARYMVVHVSESGTGIIQRRLLRLDTMVVLPRDNWIGVPLLRVGATLTLN